MKKFFIILAILIASVATYMTFNHYTYKFSHMGDYRHGNPIVSPTGDYIAQMYFENYGGAAGGVNFIVNIISDEENVNEQTIYFSDAKGSNYVQWLSDNTIFISNMDAYENRSVELVVGQEVYEELGGACGTYRVKKQFTCYSKDTYSGNQ